MVFMEILKTIKIVENLENVEIIKRGAGLLARRLFVRIAFIFGADCLFGIFGLII